MRLMPAATAPIRAVILTGADIDAITGLLTLRERQPFTVWATDYVLQVLRANALFNVLNRELVQFRAITPGRSFEPVPGLVCQPIDTPGKPPLYLEGSDGIAPVEGSSIGIEPATDGRRAVFMPACADITLEILTPRAMQDYQSIYLNLYQEFRSQRDANKESINDEVVFEIELIKQVEINVD